MKTVTTQDIHNFIAEQDALLIKKFGDITQTNTQRLHARTIKLMEEVGELANEVLASGGDQRAIKLNDSHDDNLRKEIADVLIVTFLIAKCLDIDPFAAIAEKMDIVRARQL